MEEDENLEQILDKSNEKLHISDVIMSILKTKEGELLKQKEFGIKLEDWDK